MKPDFDTVMERFRQRAQQRVEAFEAELAQSRVVAEKAQEWASKSKAPQRPNVRRRRSTAVQGVLRSPRS
ncbi:hypothetical protein [Corynebacterium kalinowskii]|uniref:hypothetical protein n=1 Tax=Corynebacterium kalinowskii TaxID=2675216 RepID=UPI0012E2E1F1|nr:hypothetical protein [Corynebacterium kalinowskii]